MKKNKIRSIIAMLLTMALVLSLTPITIVHATTIESMKVVGAKYVYFVGESFAQTTGKLNVEYSDATTSTVDFDSYAISFSGFDSSEPKKSQTITVAYGGATTTYQIEIMPENPVGDYELKKSSLNNWDPFNGTVVTKTPGSAEDGVGAAFHITGGANGGGLQLLADGVFGGDNTHPDGKVISGLYEAHTMVYRVKSNRSFNAKFVLEYRHSKSPTVQSKSFTIPSTNNEWKDIFIPLKNIEPDEDGSWIYSMKHTHNGSNFEPVVYMKLEGVNFGSSYYATIDHIRFLWFKDIMVDSIQVVNQKTSYYQYYDPFAFHVGKLLVTRGTSTVSVNGKSYNNGTASDEIYLQNGDNIITIDSKSSDGTVKPYKINVNSTANNNPNLKNITMNYGVVLNEPFDKDRLEYTANVPWHHGKIKYTCTAEESTTTFRYNGNTGTEVTLAGTETMVDITAIALDGTSKTYQINMIRTPQNDDNADLHSISWNKAYLDRNFHKSDNATYIAKVANNATSVKFTAWKDDTGATMKFNNLTAETSANLDTNKETTITISAPETHIQIEVTSKSGVVKTYDFLIQKNVGEDESRLFTLGGSDLSLDSTYTPDVTEYTGYVGNGKPDFKLKPTALNTNASIKIYYDEEDPEVFMEVASGKDSGKIPMGSEPKTVRVEVTSFDESSVSNYYVTARPFDRSTNANLFDPGLSVGELNEEFSPAETEYTVNVPNGVTKMNFTPLKEDHRASEVSVNAKKVNHLATSADIDLSEGETKIPILVKPQSGSSKTYNINVTRAAADDTDNGLFDLKLSAGAYVTKFEAGNTTARAKVSTDTPAISLTPILNDSGATVKINGMTVANESQSSAVILNAGENTITIDVKAKDGTGKTYTLIVEKVEGTPENNNLLTLLTSFGKLDKEFSPDETEYTLSLPPSIGKITVTATKEASNAKFEELGLGDAGVRIGGFKNEAIKNNVPITVSYLNASVKYNINVVAFLPPDLMQIRVDNPKLTYFPGDAFDFSDIGGKIVAEYEDGEEEEVALDDKNAKVYLNDDLIYDNAGVKAGVFEAAELGDGQVIKVTYGGKETTYNIDVVPFEPEDLLSIETKEVQALYKVGDSFNLNMGYITAKWDGSADQKVDLAHKYVKIEGFDSSAPVMGLGQKITVSYGGKSTEYYIHIIEDDKPLVRQVEVKPGEGGLAVWYGSAGTVAGANEDGSPALHFTSNNAQVVLNSNIGDKTYTHPDGVVTTGFVGANAVGFRYKSTAAATFSFYFEYRADNSIPKRSTNKFTLPNTDGVWMDYVVSFEGLSPEGWGDWIYNNMKGGYTTDFQPVMQLRGGANTCTIGAIRAMWFETDAVESIEGENLKRLYQDGEEFDYNAGTINVNYAHKKDALGNPLTINVPLDRATVSGFGEGNDITLSYAGAKYTYSLLTPGEIRVEDPKLTYYETDEFDYSTGNVIIKDAETGEDVVIPLDNTDVIIEGFDTSQVVAQQVVTVRYGDLSTTYTIEVQSYHRPDITAIELKDIQTLYKVGDPFNVYGGYIEATLTNGKKEKIYLDAKYVKIEGFDSSASLKDQEITITYSRLSKKYKIYVIEDEIPYARYVERTMASDSKFNVWAWSSTAEFVGNANEDGASPALHLTGDNGGGGQMVFAEAAFGAGEVNHSGDIKTIGFIGADAIKFRYKSNRDLTASFVVEYRKVPKSTLTSKSFILPNTDGEWQDHIVTFDSIRPDDNGRWIYEMRNVNDGEFNPAVTVKYSTYGTENYCTIGNIKVLWKEDSAVESITGNNLELNYAPGAPFNYTKGNVTVKYAYKPEITTDVIMPLSNMMITGLESGSRVLLSYAGAKYGYNINGTTGSSTISSPVLYKQSAGTGAFNQCASIDQNTKYKFSVNTDSTLLTGNKKFTMFVAEYELNGTTEKILNTWTRTFEVKIGDGPSTIYSDEFDGKVGTNYKLVVFDENMQPMLPTKIVK